MQIAVAVAHIAAERARLKQERKCGERVAAQAVDLDKYLAVKPVLSRGEGSRIVLEHRAKRLHGRLWCEISVRASVKGCNDLRQMWHGGQLEASFLGPAVIELGLVEAAHHQHPLHGIALSAEMKFALVILSDGNDLEIKLRC